jgi:hypothetical protein
MKSRYAQLLTVLLLHVPLIAKASDDGWNPLFNGKDLTNWSGDPRVWKVEDSAIVGTTEGLEEKLRQNTFLIWQGGEVNDFELEFSARVTGDNNSGLQYRSKVIDLGSWIVGGYQFDLHANPLYLAMLYDERGRGILCQHGQRVVTGGEGGPQTIGELEIRPTNLGEWNRYRLVARGAMLRHFVNGNLVAETRDTDKEKRAEKGIIALQLHAGPPMKVEFKDLRIRSWEKMAEARKRKQAEEAEREAKENETSSEDE